MDTPTLIMWGLVEMVGVFLAIFAFGPSSYRHRARHRVRWYTAPSNRAGVRAALCEVAPTRQRD